MAARLMRTRPSLSPVIYHSLFAGRGWLGPSLRTLATVSFRPASLHMCVCVSELVCLCDGIPWQSRNAKSALPFSFSPQPPLTLSLSLSHSLSVGLQLFCKEVPSNRVLNVKFKWQSSSNEMMLGAGNWKPEFADGSATGIVVPPRLHFMICEFVANLQLLL